MCARTATIHFALELRHPPSKKSQIKEKKKKLKYLNWKSTVTNKSEFRLFYALKCDFYHFAKLGKCRIRQIQLSNFHVNIK